MGSEYDKVLLTAALALAALLLDKRLSRIESSLDALWRAFRDR